MSPRSDASSQVLDRLYEVIERRRDERPAGSYVVTLLDGGLPAISAKLREESEEVIVAASDEDAHAVTHEAADVVFHLLVLLAARAGAESLEDRLGATVETLTRTPDGGGGLTGFDRGVRVVPRAPDALPLLLLERDVPQPGDASLAALDIAVVLPDVVVSRAPDCGCDACDSGSRDLLQAIDDAIGQVVDGPFVVVRRGKTWQAQWHRDGFSAHSDGWGPDFDSLAETCSRLAQGEAVALPEDAKAFVGRSWID